MAVILIAAWLGFLALLVKIGILHGWAPWMKASPVAVWVLCQLAFFIPMGFDAPSGRAVVMKHSIQIVPSVTGIVTDVPVESGVAVKQGDVLLELNRDVYQASVDRLKAQLAETIQNVQRLQATADAAAATVRKTESDTDLLIAKKRVALTSVTAAEAALKEMIGKQGQATAVVDNLAEQLVTAQRAYERAKSLMEQNAGSQAELDRAEVQLSNSRNQVETARADAKILKDSVTRSEADVAAAQASANAVDVEMEQLTEAELPRVRALAREAELAATSMEGDEHTSIIAARAQLTAAEFDLARTTIRAPADGFVTHVTLRPGTRVIANTSQVLSFIDESDQPVLAHVEQIHLRNIEHGQPAEVIFKMYPGKVFEAEVAGIVRASAAGQLPPSGFVPKASDIDIEPFWVGLRLKDETLSLPPGAAGTVAIYTKSGGVTMTFRKIVLRMENWLNYIKPL